MSRKTHLSQCAPEWVEREVDGQLVRRAITFACPEADGGCDGRHRIPVNGAAGECSWRAHGELPNVTLDPSVRCSGACRMHIQVSSGSITFCNDSKSGPDWSDKQ